MGSLGWRKDDQFFAPMNLGQEARRSIPMQARIGSGGTKPEIGLRIPLPHIGKKNSEVEILFEAGNTIRRRLAYVTRALGLGYNVDEFSHPHPFVVIRPFVVAGHKFGRQFQRSIIVQDKK